MTLTEQIEKEFDMKEEILELAKDIHHWIVIENYTQVKCGMELLERLLAKEFEAK